VSVRIDVVRLLARLKDTEVPGSIFVWSTMFLLTLF